MESYTKKIVMNETDVLILKKNIINAKNQGYNYIIITYEGSGDSGMIEDVYMSKEIPTSIWDTTDGEETIIDNKDVIENWAYYTALRGVSDWYNDDGGYGMIVINVNDGTYEVENNVRYMNISTETHSGKI